MVVHRVVRHVDHVVTQGGTGGERRPDAGHAFGGAVDDAIEVDEEEHGTMLPSAHAPGPPHHALRRHRPPHHRRHQPALPPRDGDGRGGPGLGDRRADPRGGAPATITIDLVFDGVGHGVYGRLAQKMVVRYSGRRAADDTILDLVSEATMHGGGPAAADRVLVVTNDRGLRDHLAAKGARTAPLQWFIGKLDVPAPAVPATGSRAAGDRRGPAPRARRARRRGTPRATTTARAGSPAAARPPRPARRTRSPATSATRAPGLTWPAAALRLPLRRSTGPPAARLRQRHASC